ncbi:MAG: ShlB/FhaC/HecB family hemolysin secretion/activation protein [Candidatus Omnitrophica bacterium]|nr:ShlB/FhaC/HecB family hemolysin secretion/activation protein [Candidatus Omnitrophota bacterium]
MIRHSLNRYAFIAAALLFFSWSLDLCHAQQSPPPGDEPGAQASRYQDDEREKKALEKKELKAPEIEVQKPEEKKEKGGPSFVLKEVVITGATIFTQEELKPVYEPYLGKETNFDGLNEIAKQIKSKYTQKGYVTTIVYIPEQQIAEGKVEIKVAEGKAGEVKIEGNKWFSSSLLRKYIHIKKNDILNLAALQKDLLRLNKNSDLEVKTVIAQGKEPGTSDIVLRVSDNKPNHVGLSFDNQGTRLIGVARGAASLRSTNLIGNNDYLYISTSATKSSLGQYISYLFPIDTYGTKIGLDFTDYQMKLIKDYEPSDIIGHTLAFTPHAVKELYISDNFEADLDAGIEIKSIIKKTSGEMTTNDQLRLPFVSLNLTKTDSFLGGGQTTFTPRFTTSLEDYFGASEKNHPSASRDDTGGNFFKYELVLRRTQRMSKESYISLRSQFQDASHTLPSSEQLQLGGAYSIRGYPEGDYIADRGGFVSIDWVFPMYLLREELKMPGTNIPLRRAIQPVLFMDAGYGNLKKTLPGEQSSKFLMGLGGGFRISVGRNVYVRLDWAGHVGDRPAAGMGPSNFHASFQFEI